MHIISAPSVPSVHAIHETLRTGSEITIRGHVTHSHHKDFAVELLSGPHIVLHINFRFHFTEHSVVMNTCTYGQWGTEIRHHNPLKHHDPFSLTIIVHEGYYQVSVNGVHLADFSHRIPFASVQALGLQGCVHVDEVTFTGFDFSTDWTTNYDFGHGGYIGYGTDTYEAPVFPDSHTYNAYFN